MKDVFDLNLVASLLPELRSGHAYKECEMKSAGIALVAVAFWLVACTSPEVTRTRGGGPGADVGNRTRIVEMHEGSKPFEKTPQIITMKHPSLEPARQAYELSRR
jgi:hypothetical protein